MVDGPASSQCKGNLTRTDATETIESAEKALRPRTNTIGELPLFARDPNKDSGSRQFEL